MTSTCNASRTRRTSAATAGVMTAQGAEIGAIAVIEIVSTATETLTVVIAIAHALAHLNMTHTPPSADALSRTVKLGTETRSAQVFRPHAVATIAMMTATNAAAVL